jgi:hypothetical protein
MFEAFKDDANPHYKACIVMDDLLTCFAVDDLTFEESRVIFQLLQPHAFTCPKCKENLDISADLLRGLKDKRNYNKMPVK